MINLLSPQGKKYILLEERKRLAVILSFLVLVFLVCLVLILCAIRVYLAGQAEAQRIIFGQQEKEFMTENIQQLQKQIDLTNLTFSKLNSFYEKQIKFTAILERISQNLPLGIYLTDLSVSSPGSEEKSLAKFFLSGFSPSREALFQLKENLERQNDFSNIYFPPENWVKPANINFNVSFEINPVK